MDIINGLITNIEEIMNMIFPGFLFYYIYLHLVQQTIRIDTKTLFYSAIISYMLNGLIPYSGIMFYVCLIILCIAFFIILKILKKSKFNYRISSDYLFETSDLNGAFITIISHEKDQIIQGKLGAVGFYEEGKRKLEIMDPTIQRFSNKEIVFDIEDIPKLEEGCNKNGKVERTLIYTECEKDILFIDHYSEDSGNI